MTAMAQGQVAGARELVIESMRLQDELAFSWGPMILLFLCAGLAAVQGQWQRSARFEGAAIFLLARTGRRLVAGDKVFVDSISTRTREALGDVGYETARAAGRDPTVEEVLTEVQVWLLDAP
jgi:hypothetical protein